MPISDSQPQAVNSENQTYQEFLTSPRVGLAAHGGDYVMSIPDAARVLSVCSRTVWRLVENRKLRAIRLSERRRGIMASEIAAYLNRPAC
jgi:excisionase family DNA binding protein